MRAQMFAKVFNDCFRHTKACLKFIHDGRIEVITSRDFRIPFKVY